MLYLVRATYGQNVAELLVGNVANEFAAMRARFEEACAVLDQEFGALGETKEAKAERLRSVSWKSALFWFMLSENIDARSALTMSVGAKHQAAFVRIIERQLGI